MQVRALNGNTVNEVSQTMRLNSIKLKHPAGSIVALDFSPGITVVKPADGNMVEPVRFDTTFC